MFKIVCIAVAAAAVALAPTVDAVPICPQPPCDCDYGPWHMYPGRPGVWYRSCYVESGGCIERHYVTWYESNPCHCYCYNPRTQTYWGRWWHDANTQAWVFAPAARRLPNALPLNVPFGEPAAALIPGTPVVMPAPAPLPPV